MSKRLMKVALLLALCLPAVFGAALGANATAKAAHHPHLQVLCILPVPGCW
jgi:hypothetical protein